MSERLEGEQMAEVQRGLRMAHPKDPAELEAEKRALAEVEKGPLGRRIRYYMGLIGPGYLQSAMTLGGGTAATSLFAGAVFGYKLLWVAPVAMLFGVVMLSAISYQTLSTGMRPFEAMRRYAGAPFAWGWALAALVSSVIWHFPQYSLAAVHLVDVGEVFGIGGLSAKVTAFVVLAGAVALSMMYGGSDRLIRWYERILKYMVWTIVVCFGYVVWKTGVSDWGALFKGFFAFEIPGEKNGTSGGLLVVSGLAAAVGANMVFLFPYSQLARGWGREHRGLARFDLFAGMFVPYMLATSLMVIATANTLNLDPTFSAPRLAPIQAAESLSKTIGPSFGRLVFDAGIIGMALSSITLHMLTCGFVCTEVFGWKVGSLKHRLSMLIPTPAVFAPWFWGEYAIYLAVPTTVICGALLPISYIAFIRMQLSKAYLGDDRPKGPWAKVWLGLMIVATIIMIVGLIWAVKTKGPAFLEQLEKVF